MAFTTFSGPLRSGTVKEGSGRNTGLAVLAQSYNSGDLTGDEVGNIDALAFKIPQGSQIVDITVDQIVAATAGTTTVSVGSTSGGAELMAAVEFAAAHSLTPSVDGDAPDQVARAAEWLASKYGYPKRASA